ncbi:Rrp15p-domain-containing protein [Blastocladiella britannica]|nr:Rrp15p-domain-containing protein [Blastocladiella britannica]
MAKPKAKFTLNAGAAARAGSSQQKTRQTGKPVGKASQPQKQQQRGGRPSKRGGRDNDAEDVEDDAAAEDSDQGKGKPKASHRGLDLDDAMDIDIDEDSFDDASSSGGDNDDNDDEEDLPRLGKKQAKRPTRPLSDAIADILSTKVSAAKRAASAAPILSRTAIERRLEEQKLEAKARKVISAENKLDYSKEHISPGTADLEYEKRLRKVSTRGVVKLFNAVRQSQQKMRAARAEAKTVVETQAVKAKVVSTAKSAFLDILRRGRTAQEKPTSILFAKDEKKEEDEDGGKTVSKDDVHAGKGTWNVLEDGFMMDAKLKDWEEESEDEMECE